jgi:hypothetical protein
MVQSGRPINTCPTGGQAVPRAVKNGTDPRLVGLIGGVRVEQRNNEIRERRWANYRSVFP